MVKIVQLEYTMTNEVQIVFKKQLLRTISLRHCEQKYKFLEAEKTISVIKCHILLTILTDSYMLSNRLMVGMK